MLSIKLITSGGEEYYINLAAEDYYLVGGEPPGIWVGGGASELGLEGPVVADVFRKVFRGYHPSSGVGMVQNAGHSDRQAGWDFTFCAPKSVSIVWSQLPSTLRHRIQEFQQQAVEMTLRYAEENLAFSRAGKGGSNFLPVKLVAAALIAKDRTARGICHGRAYPIPWPNFQTAFHRIHHPAEPDEVLM